MGKITFTKSSHKYESDGRRYRSVTGIISKFKQQFDSNFWSSYKAYEEILPNFTKLKKKYKELGGSHKDKGFLDYLGAHVEDEVFAEAKQGIKQKWRAKGATSSRKGTRYHDDREKTSYLKGIERNPRTGEEFPVQTREDMEGDNSSWVANLYDLEDGFYPELLLWNDKHRIAGQADRVFIDTVGDVRYIDIGDYKTNEKLPLESYFDWVTKKYQMMQYPIQHIQDCKFQWYSLQLSMYAWLMEQYGFKCRYLTIHHLNQLHKVDYLHREVEDILKVVGLPK